MKYFSFHIGRITEFMTSRDKCVIIVPSSGTISVTVVTLARRSKGELLDEVGTILSKNFLTSLIGVSFSETVIR